MTDTPSPCQSSSSAAAWASTSVGSPAGPGEKLTTRRGGLAAACGADGKGDADGKDDADGKGDADGKDGADGKDDADGKDGADGKEDNDGGVRCVSGFVMRSSGVVSAGGLRQRTFLRGTLGIRLHHTLQAAQA